MDYKALYKLKNRIFWLCENKVNAFSPTISPAPKSMEYQEIESIYEGLRYYYDRGVHEFVAQKKYMGSYCDIYLHADLEQSYFVSRNGHLIDYIDLEKAKNAIKVLHQKFDWTDLNMVIVQSEMMPWSVLGKGLIENEYHGYLNAHKNHYEHLISSSLYEKIELVKQKEEYIQFKNDLTELGEKQLKKKYPTHVIRQYKGLVNFATKDLTVYKHTMQTFEAQVHHFGQDHELHFKPFNILKKMYKDGREEIVNDNTTYEIVNEDQFFHFEINDEVSLKSQYEKLKEWFAGLTENNEEGIVLKPRKAFIEGLPPAFKIRNDQYLSMIYGLDFVPEFDRYFKKRNIGRKVTCSVQDWMHNWQLLQIPYDQITQENYYMKNIFYDRIMGESDQKTLDPRL